MNLIGYKQQANNFFVKALCIFISLFLTLNIFKFIGPARKVPVTRIFCMLLICALSNAPLTFVRWVVYDIFIEVKVKFSSPLLKKFLWKICWKTFPRNIIFQEFYFLKLMWKWKIKIFNARFSENSTSPLQNAS